MKLIPQACKDVNSTRAFRNLSKAEQQEAITPNRGTQPNRARKAKRAAKGQKAKDANIVEDGIYDEAKEDEDSEEVGGLNATGKQAYRATRHTSQTEAEPAIPPQTIVESTNKRGIRQTLEPDGTVDEDSESHPSKRRRQDPASDEIGAVKTVEERPSSKGYRVRKNRSAIPPRRVQRQPTDQLLPHQNPFADDISRIA